MTPTNYRSTLRAAASELARAKRVLVITGAGLSADSGLPTYRGVGGLYSGGVTEDGISIETALSGSTLQRQPEVTWKYILQIARACVGHSPNAGHHALAQMQHRFQQFTVLTQNVDGLHVTAGSRDLIEIHGDLRRVWCTQCSYELSQPAVAALNAAPICPCCTGILRPNVVLFGEALPGTAIERLEQVLNGGVDFVMSIGTSSGFPYIAGPVVEAARQGLPTLEINLELTEVSYLVRHRLAERAAVALPDLWSLIDPRRSATPLAVF